MIKHEVIEGAWYENGYGNLIGPMVLRYKKFQYCFSDGNKSYTKEGAFDIGSPSKHDLDITKPLKADGTPWEDIKDQKDAEEIIQYSKELSESMGHPTFITQKQKETKVEKKVVSIELPEFYVRNIAKKAVEYWNSDYEGMEIPKMFITKCGEWVTANPEPKKTRPMTSREKLEWASENLERVVSVSHGEYCSTSPCKVEQFPINLILAAHSWTDENGVPHKFEVEVEG